LDDLFHPARFFKRRFNGVFLVFLLADRSVLEQFLVTDDCGKGALQFVRGVGKEVPLGFFELPFLGDVEVNKQTPCPFFEAKLRPKARRSRDRSGRLFRDRRRSGHSLSSL
jgi:hypothetical protein